MIVLGHTPVIPAKAGLSPGTAPTVIPAKAGISTRTGPAAFPARFRMEIPAYAGMTKRLRVVGPSAPPRPCAPKQ